MRRRVQAALFFEAAEGNAMRKHVFVTAPSEKRLQFIVRYLSPTLGRTQFRRMRREFAQKMLTDAAFGFLGADQGTERFDGAFAVGPIVDVDIGANDAEPAEPGLPILKNRRNSFNRRQ
jgi:hypothetical protein